MKFINASKLHRKSGVWGTPVRWRWKVLEGVLLLGVGLVPIACSKSAETAPTEVYVQAVHPERGAISEPITADATLAPLAQAAISPKVTAPVKKFYVQRGSHVKAGQLLATLENSDLEAAALDNKGAYNAAQGSYDIATGATVPEDAAKAELDLAQAAPSSSPKEPSRAATWIRPKQP
jgi:multidrug efflux pump subunit AcrA (membrane-fusion protein)